jgi:hypothetical protein
VLSGAGIAGRAWAHHSFAMFDYHETVNLTGTVQQFQWTNPHVWIQLEIPDSAGAGPKEWSVQLTSVNFLYRVGWRHDTLKPGDKVRLSVHPLKKGGAVGSLAGISSVNGKPFTLRAIG